MFVLYLMNYVDKNNCVSPTGLGKEVGQDSKCSFEGGGMPTSSLSLCKTH